MRRAPKSTVARSAPRFAHRGGPPRGKGVRSSSWLGGLHHRPPRPSRTCSRRFAGPRGSADRAVRSIVKWNVRAPHDLGAVFPDTTWSVPPDIAIGLPLVGLSKERPSIGQVEESTPGGCRHPPSGTGYHARSAFRPRGFAPPRRFAPPRPCGLVASRCRSWGSPRFRLSRNSLPRDASLPSEAFLPAGSCAASTPPGLPPSSPPRRGAASPHPPSRVDAFTASLALLTFPSSPVPRRLPVASSSRSRASRALLHLRVRYLLLRLHRGAGP